jgi:hypothetical protein
MTHRILGIGLLLVCLAGFTGGIPGQDKKPPDKKARAEPDLNILSLEVSALETLDSLEVTIGQLNFLEKTAPQTANKIGQRTRDKASPAYRKALMEYHAALVKKADEEKLEELHEKLGGLNDSDPAELADGWELTDAACQHVPELLRRLTATQVGSYIGTQTIGDPLTSIQEALDKSQDRNLSDEDWNDTRDEAADEVAQMLTGIDLKKAEKVSKEVTALLNSARQLKGADFTRERPKLVGKARALIGRVGPLDVIRNTIEYDLANLLSNPRLAQAVATRKQLLSK